MHANPEGIYSLIILIVVESMFYVHWKFLNLHAGAYFCSCQLSSALSGYSSFLFCSSKELLLIIGIRPPVGSWGNVLLIKRWKLHFLSQLFLFISLCFKDFKDFKHVYIPHCRSIHGECAAMLANVRNDSVHHVLTAADSTHYL
jgi:hypothetical protein